MPAITAAHLFVYSALYLLFVGAVFHSAFAKPDGGMTLLQVSRPRHKHRAMMAVAMRIAARRDGQGRGRPGSLGTCVFGLAPQREHHLSPAAVVAVFAQVNSLPRAEA